MQSPDGTEIVLWILCALTSVVLVGLLIAGFYDDYRSWRSRKKGGISFAFPSSGERRSVPSSGDMTTVYEPPDETARGAGR